MQMAFKKIQFLLFSILTLLILQGPIFWNTNNTVYKESVN